MQPNRFLGITGLKILLTVLKSLYIAQIWNKLNWIDSVGENQGEFDYVVGLGGGVACDTAKYFAWKLEKPLITIPSIISVDAFLSKEIGIRVDSRVRYVGSAIADKLIIDFDLIRNAPPQLNRAGIGDVISCATALGD